MSDSDLAELRKQCITSLYLCTDNVSKYVDEDKEAQFQKLKSYVEGYCMLEAQQEVAMNALERAKNETEATNVDSLQDRFSAHLSSLAGKRLNVQNHPYMSELNHRIQKGLQNVRYNLDESDIAITESANQYIDPITKRPIVKPVKNTKCGHIYEQDAIFNLIKMKKTRCPVAGCGNKEPVLMQHLLPDDELNLCMTQYSTMIQECSIMDLDSSQEG